MFKKYTFTLIIGALFVLFLSWGMAQALSEQVQIGGVVEPSFLKISAKLVNFSTENNLYEYAHVPFETTLQNTGEVSLRPEGKIVIKNYFNQVVAIIPVNQYEIAALPGQNQNYFSQWDRKNSLGIGAYSASLVINYGVNETINAKLNFWIFPWRLTLLMIIYFLAIYIIRNLFWHIQLRPSTRLNLRPHH